MDEIPPGQPTLPPDAPPPDGSDLVPFDPPLAPDPEGPQPEWPHDDVQVKPPTKPPTNLAPPELVPGPEPEPLPDSAQEFVDARQAYIDDSHPY